MLLMSSIFWRAHRRTFSASPLNSQWEAITDEDLKFTEETFLTGFRQSLEATEMFATRIFYSVLHMQEVVMTRLYRHVTALIVQYTLSEFPPTVQKQWFEWNFIVWFSSKTGHTVYSLYSRILWLPSIRLIRALLATKLYIFRMFFARYFAQKCELSLLNLPIFLGWCTIRPPLEDVNKEPGFAKGWGFCGKEEDQLTCDKQIDTSYQWGTNYAHFIVAKNNYPVFYEMSLKNLHRNPFRVI